MEESTKFYGVPLLLSGDLYKLLSFKTKKKLRLLDKVVFKGGVAPMSNIFFPKITIYLILQIELYTFDLNTSKLRIVHEKVNANSKDWKI